MIKTRVSAEKMLEWCVREPNAGQVKTFDQKLTKALQSIIDSSIKKSHNCNREKLWREYYLLRTSKAFVKQWTDFLSTIDITVQPVLFQHLTDEIFKRLVQDYFKMQHLEQETVEVTTNEENNVIRYIAGYVCRHL